MPLSEVIRYGGDGGEGTNGSCERTQKLLLQLHISSGSPKKSAPVSDRDWPAQIGDARVESLMDELESMAKCRN
jgi:hypothetical protein